MLLINKPIGMTPLESIQVVKNMHPELRDETISYAGRLDPMAQGLLVLLLGEENKRRHDFEHMPKAYTFEMVVGIMTDTYDLLGMPDTPTSPSPIIPESSLAERLTSLLPSYIGTHKQTFPPYSSKPVHGHPLYWWARKGRLSEIILPEHEITITSLSLLSQTSLPLSDIRDTIRERITRVSGDFRQAEILSSWENFFQSSTLPDGRQHLPVFPLLTLQVSCSSGTYVRSIAHSLGEQLGTGALAYSITRTKVGRYRLEEAIQLEPIA